MGNKNEDCFSEREVSPTSWRLVKSFLDIDRKIRQKVGSHYQEEYELLQTIPGVKENASTIIAEMGVEMERFLSERHLSSWAGMSPGNNESTGMKKPGRTTYGNKCLKTMLTEFAGVDPRQRILI